MTNPIEHENSEQQSTALVPLPIPTVGERMLEQHAQWIEKQADLIRQMFAKDATPEEFQLFIIQCKRTGLDPFNRQICAVHRYDKSENKKKMSIQVTIDGLRLIADRTGRYAPGRQTEFEYDDRGRLLSATAFVQKHAHNRWHEVAEVAHWDEYAQMYKAYGKDDLELQPMWASKPHIMLAKCAEARALRRAFPAETSGLYAREELGEVEDDDLPNLQSEGRSPTPVAIRQAAKRARPQNPIKVRLYNELIEAGLPREEIQPFITDNLPSDASRFDDLDADRQAALAIKLPDLARKMLSARLRDTQTGDQPPSSMIAQVERENSTAQ